MVATQVRESAAQAGGLRFSKRQSLMLLISAILALVIGVGSVAGGIVGAVYTWGQAVAQNVTTPADASIASTPVRGPLTMKAQSDIIMHHELTATGGLYYSEMPRQVAQVDANGNAVLDADGNPVMVANTARDGWITATTLTSALGLGILAYAVSAFAIVVGLALVACGIVFLMLRTPKTARGV